MPRLSRWFIRSALFYLLFGFTLGALMLANKGVPFEPALWRLRPAHIEILLIGWVLQLGMGMAFWMLPRFWHGPPRGSEIGAQVAYVLLNLGVWLVVFGSVLAWPNEVLIVGRAFEAGAAVAFATHLWPRVVPRL